MYSGDCWCWLRLCWSMRLWWRKTIRWRKMWRALIFKTWNRSFLLNTYITFVSFSHARARQRQCNLIHHLFSSPCIHLTLIHLYHSHPSINIYHHYHFHPSKSPYTVHYSLQKRENNKAHSPSISSVRIFKRKSSHRIRGRRDNDNCHEDTMAAGDNGDWSVDTYTIKTATRARYLSVFHPLPRILYENRFSPSGSFTGLSLYPLS